MTELVKSVSIENLVNQRAAIVERVTEAKRLWDEANQLALSIGIEGVPSAGYHGRFRRDMDIRNHDYAEATSAAIDAKLWDKLMKDSGLRSFMDAGARAEWDRQLADLTAPPLTPENVKSTFASLYAARAEMFERGVVECFRSLSWDYKTNNPCRFGKRIIMGFFGALCWNADYRQCDRLDDLERVLHVLDQKPEPDHRQGWYGRLPVRLVQASSDYLTVKRFKNGNAHVHFRRADLVEQMNEIIARHYPGALPARV